MPDLFDVAETDSSTSTSAPPPTRDLFDTVPLPAAPAAASVAGAPATAPQAKGDLFDTVPMPAIPAPSAQAKDLFDTVPVPSQPAPTPGAQPSAPSLPTSGPTISPYNRTVWDRIHDFFTGGNPNFTSKTVYDPDYGKTSLTSFKSWLSPKEQEEHPVLTGIYETADDLQTPKSVATIAATAGLGELAEAGSIIPRLVSLGFSADMIVGAAKSLPEVAKAIQSGNTSEAYRLLTHVVLSGGLAALGLKHAASGKGAVSGKTAPSMADVVPHEADSPVAQVVSDAKPVPEVQITDTGASKAHVESQSTVAEAKPPAKVFHGTSADVTDISKLRSDQYGTPGFAGIGDYLTTRAEDAGKYAGPADVPTGGRVIAGILSPDTNLLDAHAPLPDPIRSKASLPADLPKDASYLDAINAIRENNPSDKLPSAFKQFQKIVGDEGYHGVTYSNGIRGGILLFPKDVSSRSIADLVKPALPTARIVADDYTPVVSKNEILAQGIQTMIENSRELQKLGLDPSKIESKQDVYDMLDTAADHIKSNLDDRANSVLTFDLQKQLASELGMSVEDLLSTKSGQAFNAEQAVAARAILKESQTNVMNLARNAATGDASYLKAFTDSLAQHKLILDAVKGEVSREAGRALGSFRIPESDLPQARIAEQLAALSPEAQIKAAQLLDKIDPNDKAAVNSFIEKIKPSSTSDKIFEYYRNALLSSPKTAIVKGASEVTMMALEATKKVVAGGLSKAKSIVTGAPQERLASESYWYAKGAAQALRNAGDVLTGKFQLEDAPGFEGGGSKAIKGPLGSLIRVPQTILSKQTNLMYMLNYFGELNAQAARQAVSEGLSGTDLQARQEYLANNPTEEMTKAANDLALKNTFQSELGKTGTAAQRLIKTVPLGRYLFPFFKTPLNLVKASGEYSPYGLLKGLAKGDVDAQARGLVGSSIAAAVAYHTLQGHITGGGPVDFRKKQTLEATGWQPYSVKIGGKFYSYHRAEPIGLVAGLVADTVHGIHIGDSPEVTQSKADTAVSHVMRNVNDFPFLMQMSNLLQALEDPSGKKVSNFIDKQVSSFVPAGVANIAEMADRTVRHPEGLAQNIESRIPGQTSNVPPSLDITGQPLQRPESQLGGANPFPVSEQKNDPVLNELARLGVSTPQPPKNVKIRKTDMPLTETEREQLAQREGNELRKILIRATVQPSWVRKTDDQRRAEINAIRREITQARPARVMSMRKETMAAYTDMPFEEFLDRYQKMSDDEKATVKPVLVNKSISWKTQAKRGQVSAEDKDRISAKIAAMQPTN